MRTLVRSASASLVVVAGLGSVSAFAQDPLCSCATAYRGTADVIGSIRRVQGNVIVSQVAGYESAKAGTALDIGTRVVVGPQSSVSVNAGGCSLDVPANSSLDISRVSNNICLKIEGPGQFVAIERAQQNNASPGAPVASGGGAAGGGAVGFGAPEALFAGAALLTGVGSVAAATQDDNKGVSR